MSDFDETGPIDWFLIEFSGEEPKGELIPPLLELVDRRLIRILDALIVRKNADGTHVALTTSELDAERGDLGALAGASSGMLDADDAAEAAAAMEPGSAGLILVYENLWAVPFAVATRKAGGQLVAGGRIPVQAILAQLDALGA